MEFNREDIQWIIETFKPSSFKLGDFHFEASPMTYAVEEVEVDESDPISREEYDEVKRKQQEDEYLELLGHSAN